MPKTLNIKKIMRRNKGIDPARFAEANRLIGALRAKGLPERSYRLNSPFVREISPVDPQVKHERTPSPDKPPTYLTADELSLLKR